MMNITWPNPSLSVKHAVGRWSFMLVAKFCRSESFYWNIVPLLEKCVHTDTFILSVLLIGPTG